ncbi:hypothetical protein BT63DRAFT_469615 [Microthyrium microscopicum]|uniref:Uncharacterized protein n=1 Tax=Microthyrium microscopicum TaxID=703497 RepID=A0A6A6UCK7_9PEZI|nr:hypothetical protein BT63DRAFT_469615 [Microthyrium microscopicum]
MKHLILVTTALLCPLLASAWDMMLPYLTTHCTIGVKNAPPGHIYTKDLVASKRCCDQIMSDPSYGRKGIYYRPEDAGCITHEYYGIEKDFGRRHKLRGCCIKISGDWTDEIFHIKYTVPGT